MIPLLRFTANVSSIRGSADWYNTVSNMLEGLTVLPSPDGKAWIQWPTVDGKGWTLYIPFGSATPDLALANSFDLTMKTFGDDTIKPEITILEGYVNIQGESPVLVAQTDLQLDQNKTLYYVFIEMPDGGTAQILKQDGGTRPQTVAGTWRKVLYEVAVSVKGYVTVTWDRRKDFDIGSPI